MAMSDSEIIEAKSKEIKRLHKVCKEKDKAIQLAIDFLSSFGNPDESSVIQELKSYIG